VFGRQNTVVAWIVLVLAAVHPPHGLGIPLCWLDRLTGIPCPGCGLSRSLSCAIHGMFGASWEYHPFGIFFLATFAVIALASLLPAVRRQALLDFADRHHRVFRAAYLILVASFLAYGAARAVMSVAGH
jgi:hypothetical protein